MDKIKTIDDYKKGLLIERRDHFMRHLYAEGFTLEEIGTLFKVSKTAIHKILKKVVPEIKN